MQDAKYSKARHFVSLLQKILTRQSMVVHLFFALTVKPRGNPKMSKNGYIDLDRSILRNISPTNISTAINQFER
jgi:hypothetical protein